MKKGDTISIFNPKRLQLLLASQEAQAYTMAFLSFFALSFFTIFAIKPTLTSFFNLRRQIDDANILNEALDEKINVLIKAQNTYNSYRTEIELLDKALPNDPQFAQLIQKLETIVNEKESTTTAFLTNEQVTLLNTEQLLRLNDSESNISQNIEDTTSKDALLIEVPIESIKFSMTIQSSYKNNESVLANMLNLKRLIAFSILEFSVETIQEEANDDEKVINTSMNAEAYYLAEENK